MCGTGAGESSRGSAHDMSLQTAGVYRTGLYYFYYLITYDGVMIKI
jgi:hypothetical protein